LTGSSDLEIPEERLRHAATLPVLGVPVRLRSDSAEIVAVFEEAFGYWRVLEGRPDLCARERVEGRLVLDAGDERGVGRPPVRHRLVDRRRLLVATPGSLCASDADRREFTGWVTPQLLGERDHFRYHVLEALVLSVVTWLDRTPVHASAVVRDGSGLLLTGPSGRGKSTLTWAAAGAGLRVLADDMVFAQQHPPRVWGMPGFLHLPADSRRFFPELADVPAALASSGKEKLALDLHERGAAAPFPVLERMGICVIERGGGDRPTWRRLDAVELGAAMTRLDPGFDLFGEYYPALLNALAARGGWALEIGSDPHAAAAALHAVIDELDGGAR
jgi:hypothetical protein